MAKTNAARTAAMPTWHPMIQAFREPTRSTSGAHRNLSAQGSDAHDASPISSSDVPRERR